MSEQYPGGWVSKSPPTPTGPYATSSAQGLWTLSQQAQYKVQNLWPTQGRALPTYWIVQISPPLGWTSVESGSSVNAIATDSSQNIYANANLSPSSGPIYAGAMMYSLSKNGVLNWSYQYAYPTSGDSIASRMLDGSGNLWNAGYGPNNALLVKYTASNGSFVSGTQSNLAAGDIFTSITSPDSSGNFYCGGYGNGLKLLWVKFNSSGSVSASVDLGTISGRGNAYVTSMWSDTSGNTYAIGTTFYEGFFQKRNSSGSVTACSTLGGGGYGGSVNGLTIGGSSSPTYFYAVGYPYDNQGTFNIYQVATSNGSSVAGAGSYPGIYAYYGYMTYDPSGNIYLLGRDATVANKIVLIKFNSSLTIQWQRSFVDSASSGSVPSAISYDSSGSAVVFGYGATISGLARAMVVRVPADGSLTGTYGTYTYAASSYSSSGYPSGSSWTNASSSDGSWSGSMVTATGTNTAVTPTITREDM